MRSQFASKKTQRNSPKMAQIRSVPNTTVRIELLTELNKFSFSQPPTPAFLTGLALAVATLTPLPFHQRHALVDNIEHERKRKTNR